MLGKFSIKIQEKSLICNPNLIIQNIFKSKTTNNKQGNQFKQFLYSWKLEDYDIDINIIQNKINIFNSKMLTYFAEKICHIPEAKNLISEFIFKS